jgi:hypothetical protein
MNDVGCRDQIFRDLCGILRVLHFQVKSPVFICSIHIVYILTHSDGGGVGAVMLLA